MGNARNLSDLLDANGDVKVENLDNVSSYTKSATNPTITSNASLGDLWVNYVDDKVWICTDATTDNNVWTSSKDDTDIIQPNQPPTNPTNTGSFPASANKDDTFSFTFSGATDSVAGSGSPAVTHYLVDNFSSGNMTVTTAEVAAGSAHNFTVGSIGVDENFSFRVRAKDNNGAYSSGVTINITLYSVVYTVATGGTITYDGNYKIHRFTSSGTFNVTQVGTDSTVEYLVIAGAGGGGGNSGGNGGGGAGGAGGLRTSYGATSGGGAAAESNMNIAVQGYTVTVGAGGSGGNDLGTSGSSSVLGAISCVGGGRGGGNYSGAQSGGCGGGAAYSSSAGSGTAGQGYAGTTGNGEGSWDGGSGGGTASAASAVYTPGAALSVSITGSAVSYGLGGTSGINSAVHGAANTGNGGSGSNNESHANGGNGGSGVVIVRYLYQQE